MEADKRQPKGEWGPPLALISHLAHTLLKLFGSRLTFFNWKNNCFEVGVVYDSLLPLVFFLRQNTIFQLSQFVELICVDTLKRDGRFLLRYELLSVQYSVRFSVITEVNEGVSLPSLNVLYANATWLEREVWDLFGVFFRNKDLRRILTDYGFKGHPLRKDFPLSGFVELFYDERVNFLQYYPVSLAQEYRDFKFLNPWKK